MLNYHVKIGLVPIRRDCTPRPGIFNWEYAEDRARKTVAYIEEHFTSENVSFVDLKGINRLWLLRAGIDPARVDVHPDCTKCHPERYWSHRAMGDKRGGMAGVICLTGEAR